MVFYEKEMVSRRNAAIEEEQELHPRVASMVKRTKEMQKQMEKEISKKDEPGTYRWKAEPTDGKQNLQIERRTYRLKAEPTDGKQNLQIESRTYRLKAEPTD
ncbi:hypothetical protein DPMN_079718 [Dreissena polymorpha]|uniref:Uncharacterized protein n=1 Tax=Dreissena polymorpha TaxID=45954 RepID=A0A9D4BQC0_DREPO|nr:hypothetical protein DPMN_079718 [Dreissena polymorpha]